MSPRDKAAVGVAAVAVVADVVAGAAVAAAAVAVAAAAAVAGRPTVQLIGCQFWLRSIWYYPVRLMSWY